MSPEKYIKALKLIRNAYILLLISINVFGFDIFPKWLAFIFINFSLDIISKEEKTANLMKNITLVLILYHFINWMVNINNYIINIFFAILQLYVNYQLMTNIIDISIKHQSKYTNKLKRIRDILTIMFTISMLLADYMVSDSLISFVGIYIIVYLVLSIKQIFDLSMYIVEEKNKITETAES